MEKIYMDSNDKIQKKSAFKNFFNNKGSLFVAVVVAAVGIFSLILFGFNQISFAIDPNGSLPETFVSGQYSEPAIGEISGSSAGGVLPVLGFEAIIDDAGTRVPIFCIEYNITYDVGKTYTRDSEINDYGLIYLMSQLYPNVQISNSVGDGVPERVQIWLTQAAIWSYLYETGDPNNTEFSEWNEKVKLVDRIYDNTYSESGNYLIDQTGTPLFELYGVNALIAKAKTIKSNPLNALSVSKQSDTIAVTNDEKYYQSDLVSVVGSTNSEIISSFEGYSVNLTNAPEGTILVDENGNVYDDITNMAPTSKFYVRVPVDKITDETKTLNISINGNFKMFGANKYVSGEYQKVANVKLRNQVIPGHLDIDFDFSPEVPDTGMGVAQTIYFIGLIVLLSGVGIIYANAKPQENK